MHTLARRVADAGSSSAVIVVVKPTDEAWIAVRVLRGNRDA
ncbi:hypothetical protein [Burkholderia stabilis]|nr:hypothetical protein [Burkholderia stabilis]GAU07240.1 hypothetical protein BSLA_03f1593 [Burkholderia stabilis]